MQAAALLEHKAHAMLERAGHLKNHCLRTLQNTIPAM